MAVRLLFWKSDWIWV